MRTIDRAAFSIAMTCLMIPLGLLISSAVEAWMYDVSLYDALFIESWNEPGGDDGGNS